MSFRYSRYDGFLSRAAPPHPLREFNVLDGTMT
jgi:hypothetical protein